MYDVHMMNRMATERRSVSDTQDMTNMAPPDRSWHRLYVRNSLEVSRLLDELQNHPGMAKAEDLGDWVETMATLNSFRPTTRDDIEIEVRREMGVLAPGAFPEQEAQ